MLADASRTNRPASILIGGLVVLSLAAFAVVLLRHTGRAHAAAEALIAEEIAQEDRSFCGNFGMPPGTASHAACAKSLMNIRKRHHARMTRDMLGMF